MDPQHRDRIAFMRHGLGHLQARHEADADRARQADRGALADPVLRPGPRDRRHRRSRRHHRHPQPRHACGSATRCSEKQRCALHRPAQLRAGNPPPRACCKDPTKTKQLRKALDDLAEEGVIQVFYPEIGAQWIVGVVGQLQLDVLVSRLEAEYKVEAGLEAAPFATARWLKGPQAALDSVRRVQPRQPRQGPRRRSGVHGQEPVGRRLPAGKEPRAQLLGHQGALTACRAGRCDRQQRWPTTSKS